MIKITIKQLIREPLKTMLYFGLIALTGIFLVLGFNLFVFNKEKIEIYEKSFVTVGTVEQEEDGIEKREEWNAETKDYDVFSKPIFNENVNIDDLIFEGADYIKPPEFRASYRSYSPEYKSTDSTLFTAFIAEFTPLEDGIPDKPMKIEITKLLSRQNDGITESVSIGSEIWFCDHYTPNPILLKKGKTYVAKIHLIGYVHGMKENSDINELEYAPAEVQSTQATKTGNIFKGDLSIAYVDKGSQKIHEVKTGFYETEVGIQYKELIKGEEMYRNSITVVETNAVELLMPFYNQDAYIVEGRNITEKEFEQKQLVCVIPETIAKNNGLKIGDSIELNFFALMYGYPVGQGYEFLNAKGRSYEVFETNNYRIVGVYKNDAISLNDAFSLMRDTVVIPAGTISESIEENIVAYHPMIPATTSFQIENGTIDSFMDAFNKQGLENINITFYDGGFSQLEERLNQMKFLSVIFLAIGIVMMILVITLFTYIYITANNRITMIKRTLGVSKKRCLISILSGIVSILMLGSIVGGVIGMSLAERLIQAKPAGPYYDTEYSNNIIAITDEELRETESQSSSESNLIKNTLVSTGVLVMFGIILSLSSAVVSVRKEPMDMIGRRDE
jgi:Predicted permease.